MIPQRIQTPPLLLLEQPARLVRSTGTEQAGTSLLLKRRRPLHGPFELRERDTVVATLEIKGFLYASALETDASGSRTFDHVGIAPGKIVVHQLQSFRELAVFDLGFSDHAGILRLADGRTFVLNSNFWKGEAELQNLPGEPCTRYRMHNFMRRSAEVQILHSSDRAVTPSWLLMLGWFLTAYYL